jgi:hypothetical protein
MSQGPGFEIKNCTQWPLTISLEQLGPLYYGLCQPGEIFKRDTGAVWFTIKAVVSPDNKSHIDDWDCVIPVAAVVGAAVVAALTAGAGSYLALTAVADAAGIAEVGGSSFFVGGMGSVADTVADASLEAGLQSAETTRLTATVGDALLAVPSTQAPIGALLDGVLPSLENIVVEDALAAGGKATLTVGTAVKTLGAVFSKNGGVSRSGCYAGPPWPFREDMKQYSIVGGPVAEKTPDGKLLILEGTPLQIVEGWQPLLTPRPVLGSWRTMPEMPGGAVSMAMLRRDLMMGLNRAGSVYSWDGASWSKVSVSRQDEWGDLPERYPDYYTDTMWIVGSGSGFAWFGVSSPDMQPEEYRHIFIQISAADDGTVVAVDNLGNLFQWIHGTTDRKMINSHNYRPFMSDAKWMYWLQIPVDSAVRRVSVASCDLIWMADSTGTWRWDDGTQFTKVSTQLLLDIAVGKDGRVLGLSLEETEPGVRSLLEWDESSQAWNMVGNVASNGISVGSDGLVWYVYSDGQVGRSDGSLHNGVVVGENMYMQEITVSSDGAVCGIDKEGRVLTYSV